MRKFIFFFPFCIPFLSHAQGNDQNYVKEIQFLDNQGANITSVNYYNGVGDLVETIFSSSGAGNCICTFKTYDSKGRLGKRYAMVPVSNPDFRCEQDIDLASREFHHDEYVYSQLHYAPANRIIAEDIPGKKWYDGKRNNIRTYGTNTVDDRVIRYNVPIGSSTSAKKYYPAGCLEKETVMDADGNYLITFTDLAGNLVLERRNRGDTYYVYDNLGQLCYVLPPNYQSRESLSDYSYRYIYNNRGNLVNKTLPGIAPSTYWHDKEGRLIYEQDGLLRSRNLYKFYLYDNFGRMVVTGTCNQCNLNVQNQEIKISHVASAGFLETGYNLKDGLITADGATLEAVYYYDKYDFLSGSHKDAFCQIAPTQKSGGNGLLLGSIVRATNGQYEYTVNCYDTKGNLVQRLKRGLDGCVSDVTHTYNLTGALKTSVANVDVKYGEKFTVTHANAYSSWNNLITRTISVAHGADTTTATLNYSYDAINRLQKVVRPGNCDAVSYDYDVHDWPVKIESGSFKEYLTYADGAGIPCYNGNISTIKWSNKGYARQRGYKFRYDNLNRLCEATYGEGDKFSDAIDYYNEQIDYDLNGNVVGLRRYGRMQDGNYGLIDDLKVILSGNQISFVTDAAAKILYKGALDFNIDRDGKATYLYNDNGAIIVDTDRGITMIEYDNFGNPVRVQFANGNIIQYIYSAEGRKLRTIYYTAMPNIKVAFGSTHDLDAAEILAVDSADYLMDGSLILKNGRINKFLFGEGYFEAHEPVTCIVKPCFDCLDEDDLSEEERRERKQKLWESWLQHIKYNETSENFVAYYYNKDHLGNNREVVDGNGNVFQVVHYYPYGMPFCDPSATTDADLQPFKYNGKELDLMHGLNTYDYGARQYYSVVPTWDRMDPLCENFYNISPYAYCFNNPIRFVDSDGNIPFDKSVAYTHISSKFGIRKHPITGEMKGHGGIDLSTAGTGHDVHVLADGVIKKIGWNEKRDSKGHVTGYGRYVIVQHSDGYETLYAHLEKNGVSVSVGDYVYENDIIAKSGNTGGSTGPHLHLEISKGNILNKSNKIDPSSISDLQLLLYPDKQEYYGGELSGVSVYGQFPKRNPLQPLSPKISEIKIDIEKIEIKAFE